MYWSILAVFAATVASARCADFCDFVVNRNCSTYTNQPECGTNGVTYDNMCMFAKDQCKDHALHIQSHSVCGHAGNTHPPTGPSTTRAPVFLGHNAVRDFFCLEFGKEDCTGQTEPVCGTDNVAYPSFCEFEKQKCTHQSLKVRNFGAC